MSKRTNGHFLYRLLFVYSFAGLKLAMQYSFYSSVHPYLEYSRMVH